MLLLSPPNSVRHEVCRFCLVNLPLLLRLDREGFVLLFQNILKPLHKPSVYWLTPCLMHRYGNSPLVQWLTCLLLCLLNRVHQRFCSILRAGVALARWWVRISSKVELSLLVDMRRQLISLCYQLLELDWWVLTLIDVLLLVMPYLIRKLNNFLDYLLLCHPARCNVVWILRLLSNWVWWARVLLLLLRLQSDGTDSCKL